MNKHYENIREQLNKVQELAMRFCEYGNTDGLYKYASGYKTSIQNIKEVLSAERCYIDLTTKDMLEIPKKMSDTRNLIADLSGVLIDLLTNIENENNELIYRYANEIINRLERFGY